MNKYVTVVKMLMHLLICFSLPFNISAETIPGKVGQIIKSKKLEIQISSIEKKEKVGNEVMESKASEGGVYLAIQWKYKNISDAPITMFSQPTIRLIDPKKAKYSPDIDASSNYATELDIDEKIVSDLNPGITVKGAEVFEVSKELISQPGWKLLIEADQEVEIDL